MKARDLIADGETAVVILTSGPYFEVNADGSGSTGKWVIDPTRRLDKVIIYRRDPLHLTAEVFVGEPVDIVKSDRDRRYVIHLANVRDMGETPETWLPFADLKPGAQNPIRYVSRRT